MSTKKDFIKNWFQRVWTEGDKDAIYELFVPEVDEDVARGLKKEAGIGPAEFEALHQALLQQIKDIQVDIDSFYEEGDRFFMEINFAAVTKGSNKPFAIKGAVTGKIKNGVMVSANNHIDFLHLFEALNLLPDNTLMACLQGKKLVVEGDN